MAKKLMCQEAVEMDSNPFFSNHFKWFEVDCGLVLALTNMVGTQEKPMSHWGVMRIFSQYFRENF